MADSSLRVVDAEYKEIEIQYFRNAWLFAPKIHDILYNKYLPDEARVVDLNNINLGINIGDYTVGKRLNKLIIDGGNENDINIWNLGNQQVFSTKNKMDIVKAVRSFLTENEGVEYDYGEHIRCRFRAIAKAIEDIDEERYLYFTLKNSRNEKCKVNVEGKDVKVVEALR